MKASQSNLHLSIVLSSPRSEKNFSDGLGNLFRLKHRRAQHKGEKFHSFAHISRDISLDMLELACEGAGVTLITSASSFKILKLEITRQATAVKSRTPTTKALQLSRAQQSPLFVFPDITQLTSTIIFIICVE